MHRASVSEDKRRECSGSGRDGRDGYPIMTTDLEHSTLASNQIQGARTARHARRTALCPVASRRDLAYPRGVDLLTDHPCTLH